MDKVINKKEVEEKVTRNQRFNKRFSRNTADRSEFDHKIVDIRRVARVMAGGRRFSFSVVCVLGDRRGRVGVGIGKAGDTAMAIDKAKDDAKKKMIKVSLTEEQSISSLVGAKYNASQVLIKPSPGKGLVAGGPVRVVLDLAGIKDVSAKILSRSKNKLNNSRATILALKKLDNVNKE